MKEKRRGLGDKKKYINCKDKTIKSVKDRDRIRRERERERERERGGGGEEGGREREREREKLRAREKKVVQSGWRKRQTYKQTEKDIVMAQAYPKTQT